MSSSSYKLAQNVQLCTICDDCVSYFFVAALTQHIWLEAKYTTWTCTSQGGDMEESKTNPLSDIFCCKNESSELGKSYLSSIIII